MAEGNFHGRTTTIISFSTDPVARDDFGPFTPGFRVVPYGDADALRDAVDDTTVAVLIEPIQGEAGVRRPAGGLPAGGARRLHRRPGCCWSRTRSSRASGRTGTTFACDHEGVVPDVYVLGKALGGGVVPVSAVVSQPRRARRAHAGQHGSTFGGNPLACAVGHAVVAAAGDRRVTRRAPRVLGEQLHGTGWHALIGHGVVAGARPRAVGRRRHRPGADDRARGVASGCSARGVLVKDTHGSTIRLAPPIVVEAADLDWMVDQIAEVLTR